MAGLLGENWDDPRTMATFQMAAGLLGGGNFGQALGKGLGGYQQTMAYAKEMERQKMADQQAATEFEWKQSDRARADNMMAQRQTHLKALQTAMASGQVTGQELVAAGIPMDLIKEAMTVKDMGRPEVARTLDVEGPDGSKLVQQLDKFGQPVGQGVAGYTAPVQVNLGDRVGFAKPQAGQSFAMGMSPDAKASNALGWANNANARERLAFDKTGGAAGVLGAKLPPGYMWAAPGQAAPIPGTEADQKAKDAQRAREADIASAQANVDLVDKALAHPGRATATGLSGKLNPLNYIPGTDAKDFQAIQDQIAGGAFLQAFQSLKGGGAITEVEGKKAEQAIARLQTAQSDGAYEAALKDYKAVIQSGLARLGGQSQSTSKAPGTPMRGQVIDGWKFKGGNPSDPSSWEKQ